MTAKSELQSAVMAKNATEVLAALSKGASVDALDREGRTALFYAVRDGSDEIIKILIEGGSDVNLKDHNLEAPLHFAAREFQLRAATALLDAGAEVNAKDAHGNTPLWRAVFESRGRGEMIMLLTKSGADKSIKNDHNTSPEDLAKRIGNFEVSRFLA